MKRTMVLKAAIPIASIMLILTGVIQLRSQFWIAGAVCIILAMLGFILSMRLLESNPPASEELERLHPLVRPVIVWTIIVGLTAIAVLYVVDNSKSPETDRIAALVWLSSVMLGMLFTWAQALRPSTLYMLREKFRVNRIEILALFIMLTLAFVLRTFDLAAHPYPWSGDEASIGSEAIRILEGNITGLYETGWSSQPNWSFVPTAITEIIFGRNIVALRVPSVVMGTLAVLFTYLAARELFNPAIALMAGVFLATLPLHLHFSRIGVNNVADSLMSSLVFWLIARAWRTDDSRYYYTAGAMAGLCIYAYAGTRLVLILSVAMLLFFAVRQKNYLYSHWKHLASFFAAAAISAAPQAAFFARHPDIFVGRLGQEGILFNGWLTRHAAETGKSILEILFNQFTRTTMVFVASPAPGNFFNSPEPYLTVLGSSFFLLGMGYALAYILQPRYFMLLMWFWSVVLLGGILTLNPPANTRLLMTTPPLALLMALGAYKILEYLRKFRILPGQAMAPILFAAVSIVAFQNIDFYLFEYRENKYFEDANGEFAMEVSLMAREMGRDLQIFVLGAPRVYSGFPTFAFVAPDNPRIDLPAENVPSLELAPGQRAGFFAIPENRGLLDQISEKYPNGARGLVYRKSRPGEVLFEYYIVLR